MRMMKMPMVLVVDTEPDICKLIALVLQQRGFPVLTADNAAEAVSITYSHRGEIGLLITEVSMPLVDGPTLARVLSVSDPHMPVLFMSSQCDLCELNQFQGFEFLAKPFSIDALLEEVEALISETRREVVVN
jgi:two-component system cell cycle sensor histidine kinase/response regulator CckA